MTKTLLNACKLDISKEDRALVATDKTYCIPNMAEDSEMLDWAGLNFGAQDSHKFQASIKVREMMRCLIAV